MSTLSCNTGLQSLWELFDSFVYWSPRSPAEIIETRSLVPRSPAELPSVRRSFSVSDGACDRPPTLPPDMVIQGVQVGWIWRPLVFGNEIWAVGLEPVLRGTSCACWRAVLLEDVSTGQSKFINKELPILLFTNTTSQMTSLTVSWLLVILNHWKNFEQFSCTDFRTKFLSTLKSLGANTVMLITLKYCNLIRHWYDC